MKEQQETSTARLASDTTGVIGVGDIDLTRFLTKPFTGLRMFQTASGAGTFGTLGIIPDQQKGGVNRPVYRDGGALALDKAGAGNYGFNIARTGPSTDGYTRGETVLIQKRVAHTFNPTISRVSYNVSVREEPKDYVLQVNERYDGDFAPASGLGLGQEFTSIFPIDSQGRRLYNADPYTEAGWNGTVHKVEYNTETLPVIGSIDPISYQLPNNGGSPIGFITGQNLTFYTSIFIGPYRTQVQNFFSETSVSYAFPGGMLPGVYDLIVVNFSDGQLAILPNSFTVLKEEVTP
ncbi:MAG: hypothetical protein H0X33_13270 [Taibaiella sp.]|nr:hypothetical protein [Taibaiella sp.]